MFSYHLPLKAIIDQHFADIPKKEKETLLQQTNVKLGVYLSQFPNSLTLMDQPESFLLRFLVDVFNKENQGIV